ncbi:MAG TPA: non-ribosomal peptide synthetase [Acidimicrobiales bacterium]|nr:non-ribosomal peptide synthetase [Acidimicrobiales bacterium]
MLRVRAGADPGAVALVVDGRGQLGYGDWERRSDAAAAGLQAHGVGRGDRVALLFDNARWTDYAVCYLAVLKAEAIAVPLGTRFAGRELEAILHHCEAAGTVAPPDLAPSEPRGWVVSPADLETADRSSAGDARVAGEPADLAELLYTSGTTGRPKAVAVSHENLLFHDPPPDDADGGRATFVHAFPIGTNAGQEVLRLPLRRGDRTAVVLPVFDAERFCALVAGHRVRRLQLVPAMAELLLASGAVDRHDLSSVERVVLSSAPAPAALLRRLSEALPGVRIWNTYALTEAGTARTLLVYDGTRPGSVGRGVGGTEVRIVDDDGRDVPAGEVGEVWLRRPGAPLRRYFRDPEATAATFLPGGWVRTGDLGHLDNEGYLYLDDRKKDVIISGGLNVASLEVEDVLHEHPSVAEAAVFAVPHEVLGQDVAAAVVPRAAVTERELQAFVRERLAEHKTPHRVVLVERLPRNPSGKVLKQELRDTYGRGGDRPAPLPPRTPEEQVVLSVWEEVLQRGGVGVHEDFFALGGHSLAAASVAARLNDALGTDLPPDAVFEAPTVAELAAVVTAARRSAP